MINWIKNWTEGIIIAVIISIIIEMLVPDGKNKKYEGKMKRIREANFREIYKQVIYIKSTSILNEILGEQLMFSNQDDGFLAYGYIDDNAGFSFKVLCAARIYNDRIIKGYYDSRVDVILRRDSINDCAFMIVDEKDVPLIDFEEHINAINAHYRSEGPNTEEMRQLKYLDSLRHSMYPDDINVVLSSEKEVEIVWVKCWIKIDNELFGKLINEPINDYGIHCGDIIGFTPMTTKDGIKCIFNYRKLVKQL